MAAYLRDNPAYHAFVTAMTRPGTPPNITAARALCTALNAVPDDAVSMLLEEIRDAQHGARSTILHEWWSTVTAWNTPGFAEAVHDAEQGNWGAFIEAPAPGQ